jgi:putative nucleotidyltransferase with HDIG domain
MLRTRVKAGWAVGFVISLMMASLFTVVQSVDQFIDAWSPALGQVTITALRVPYGAPAADVDSVQSAILSQRARGVIIAPGTRLDSGNPIHQAVVRYKAVHQSVKPTALLGLFIIYFTLAMTLVTYLRKFGQNRLKLLRAQAGVVVLVAASVLVAKLMLLFTGVSEFWMPMAAVPLWVATGFDRRTAFVVTVVAAFGIASLLRFDLLLLSVALAAGMAATLFYRDRKRGRHMILAAVLGGVAAAGLMTSLMVLLDGSFDVEADLSSFWHSQLIGCLGGGVVSAAIGAALKSPAERLLGYVPRERLLDLTDLEQPLLKKMASEAQGSWEHARAMANLAEAASSAIGADALLTRVGAYYHDLGKTGQSKYFVENLLSGETTPHEGLDPDASAEIIVRHVTLGTQILREGGIPEPVVEFAYTHHGTQVVEYFWNKCLEQGNPKGLSEDHFRYPGMKPQTKETAILMLVDSIEAASRTIDPPERLQFEVMIQRIIFTKLRAGQLDDSGLTLRDLRVLVTRMADTLTNMHHHRIKYQWQAQQAEEFGVSSLVTRPPPPGVSTEPPVRISASPSPITGEQSPASVRDIKSGTPRV